MCYNYFSKDIKSFKGVAAMSFWDRFYRFLFGSDSKSDPAEREEDPDITEFDPDAPLPPREYWVDFKPLLEAPHILIAGSTGSGKSVLLDDFLFTLTACREPKNAAILLIDPKKVELTAWKNTAFCVGYADTAEAASYWLRRVEAEMDKRYRVMQGKGIKMWDRSDLYIIIDELADLLLLHPKVFTEPLQNIAQLGRAAKIHLIMCTQQPSRACLKAPITLNITHKIALHCDSAIESRQIIGVSGAELLPPHGEALVKAPGSLLRYVVPMTDEEKLKERQALFRVRGK